MLISLIIVSPFFRLGNATGHDFLFHVSSWLDAAGAVERRHPLSAVDGMGQLRLRRAEIYFLSAFFVDAGSRAGFRSAVERCVRRFSLLLVQTFSGLSAFTLARRILPERSALFCVACYTANPYALVIIYLRSDFAELLANAFFPLLFLRGVSNLRVA